MFPHLARSFRAAQGIVEQPLITRLLSGKEPALKLRAVIATVGVRIEAVVRIEHVEFGITYAGLVVIDRGVYPYSP